MLAYNNFFSISVVASQWHGKPATPTMANLSREPCHKLFIGTVRAVVHEINGSGEVWDRSTLPQQWLGLPPPHWIPITLQGRGSERTLIAIRGDNLHVVGFTSSDGRWYELKPKEGENPVIPGSVVLGFDGSYGDLLGYDPRRQLELLKLGDQESLEAIGILYTNPGVREQQLKTASATIIVMVCEAARIIPIRRRLSSAWGYNSRTYIGASKIRGHLGKHVRSFDVRGLQVQVDQVSR